MLKFLLALTATAAFAAPAFAQSTPPAGGVAGTTSANALAAQRSFDPVNGNNAFGGRSQGEFGALQRDVANPNVNIYGEPAGPYGQVILKDGFWNNSVPWTQ